MSINEELAKKVFEEEQARFNVEQEARFKAEQEQERIDFETALELQKKYHALQNRPFSVAEVRKNMCMYLKNQGGYKMSHFKGMSYKEIRPIFEKVWDKIQSFVPMDSEKEKGSKKKTGGRRKKSLTRKRAKETLSEESAKKQKLEDHTEKEELQVYLNIVPEEESLNLESLATKYPIVDLKTLIEQNEEDEIWRNQQDWNLINWKLHNFCGVHVLLMDTGLVIPMMVEKKYPLSQDTLSKMLSRRLEVDHQSEIVNINHMVKVSEKARILEHKQRVQESLLILTTYTPYHSRSIRRIQDVDELKDHCLNLNNTPYPHQRYAVYNTLVNEEEPTDFTSIRHIHQEDTTYPCHNFTKTSMTRRLNTPYPKAFICRTKMRLINILEYYNRRAYAKYLIRRIPHQSIWRIDPFPNSINTKP
ncbi:hypothetical protein Tco_0890434 [Tanacetum coccineum]|uniref:Uncharacterized protein n=1 Tax=Tanacetum coccineum TaxID=301880 RepID=A0ABQ5C2B5_9ASTR